MGRAGTSRLALYARAQEAIEYLCANNGHVGLTKPEFAVAMAAQYGRIWLKVDGTGNRKLVEEVCALTKDQDIDDMAEKVCAGFVITYSPTEGGMTLEDPTGQHPSHRLHMLSGDVLRQQSTKTINRRRVGSWKAAGDGEMKRGDHEMGRLCYQIENEIDATGFVSDTLAAQFLKVLRSRGLL